MGRQQPEKRLAGWDYVKSYNLTDLDFILNAFRYSEKINVQDLLILELVVFCFRDPALEEPYFVERGEFASWLMRRTVLFGQEFLDFLF